MIDLGAFLKMSYGIYLISTSKGDELSGYIANTAFQVTAEPPKLAIACHKNNSTEKIIEESGVFNLSVLEKETDAGLIGLFGYQSGHEDEKFERVDYITGKNGAPVILSHAIATFECKVVDKFDVGTHFLFIGEVTDANLISGTKEPLTYSYFRDEMKLMAPERAPTYIDRNKLKKQQEEASPEPTKGFGVKLERTAEEKIQNEDEGRYICQICGYVYDPELGDEAQGIPPGTSFEDLPEDWICPICAAAKSMFISES